MIVDMGLYGSIDGTFMGAGVDFVFQPETSFPTFLAWLCCKVL